MALRDILSRLFGPSQPSDEALLEMVYRDPWVLQCAVDFINRRQFSLWWSVSRNNWLADAHRQFPNLTAARYEAFLLKFGNLNRHKGHFEIMQDAATARGWGQPVYMEGGAIAFPTKPPAAAVTAPMRGGA